MQTVREIYSPSMLYRAEVIKRYDGLYQAEIYKWDDEWEFWQHISRGLSLIDSEDSAVKVAVEKLRNYSGENV